MKTKIKIGVALLLSMVLLTACGGIKMEDVSGVWTNTTSETIDLSDVGVDEFEIVIDTTLALNEDNTLSLTVEWADSSIEEFRTILGDYFDSFMDMGSTDEEKAMIEEQLEEQFGCTMDEFINQQVEATIAESSSVINGTFEIDGDTLIVSTEDGDQGVILVKDGVLESEGLTFEKAE